MPYLSKEEQETIIRSSVADKTWDICTADPRIINKLKKRGYAPNGNKTPFGYISFEIDFDRVRFGPAIKLKRPNAFKTHNVNAILTNQNPKKV